MKRLSRVDPPGLEDCPSDTKVIPFGVDLADEDASDYIRTALYASAGNVYMAAAMLDCPPGDLARRIEMLPSLKADREAARRLIVDRAEAVIIEQLADTDNVDRRDESARFVLTSLGKQLGWGAAVTSQSAGFSLSNGAGQTLQVRWQSDDARPDAGDPGGPR